MAEFRGYLGSAQSALDMARAAIAKAEQHTEPIPPSPSVPLVEEPDEVIQLTNMEIE